MKSMTAPLKEKQIKHLLSEKELLLKEVHHRIKNNFLSIESLLSMQASSAETEETREALRQALSRISSVRVLYDKMLLIEGYGEVAVGKYLKDLIDTITELFPEKDFITLHTDIDDFMYSSKNLFSIGIIVNELLTNIMKHAFKGMDRGIINISLQKMKDRAILIIEDNGIGLPDNFAVNNEKNVGFTLVKLMCRQISASLSLENDGGTRCTIEFAVPR